MNHIHSMSVEDLSRASLDLSKLAEEIADDHPMAALASVA